MGSTLLNAGTAPTLFIKSDKDITFAYRRFGKHSDVPIVLHIHFRGNMDFWDPLFLDTLAKEREVIIFDNAGVGKSTGTVPNTFAGWADDMISFINALGLKQVDLLGFSMGGMAALEAALSSPHLIRALIMAGSKASVPSTTTTPPPGIVWPQDTSDPKYVTAMATAVTSSEGHDALQYSCFPLTTSGKSAFNSYWTRLQSRTIEPPNLTLLPMDAGGNNQIAAVLDYDVPQANSSFDRLGELKMPVLVVNGDDDVLVPTSRSWELLRFVENAQLIIYPRSGHGFIWQFAERVGGDVNRFLGGLDL